jgi:hypothetical protein
MDVMDGVMDMWWLECPCARDVMDVMDKSTKLGWGILLV